MYISHAFIWQLVEDDVENPVIFAKFYVLKGLYCATVNILNCRIQLSAFETMHTTFQWGNSKKLLNSHALKFLPLYLIHLL